MPRAVSEPGTAQLFPPGVLSLGAALPRCKIPNKQTANVFKQICSDQLFNTASNLAITLHNFASVYKAKRDKSASSPIHFFPPAAFLHLAPFLINPLLLHQVPVGVGQASVVGESSQTLLLQNGRCCVTFMAGKAINYSRVICKHIKEDLCYNTALFPFTCLTVTHVKLTDLLQQGEAGKGKAITTSQ